MKKQKQKIEHDFFLDTITNHMDIAHAFGFTPIDTPQFIEKAPKLNSDLHNNKLSLLQFYINNELFKGQQPRMFVYELPFKKSNKRKSSKNIELGLEIIGNLESISDATIIKTAYAILEDEGYKNMYVEINSTGDKESFNKLEKDLQSYYRKNINSLPASERQLYKKSIWNILRSEDIRTKDFRDNAPKPMMCLTDESRKHFKEVLEFLEVMEIPYNINENLVGEKGISTHTFFNIKTESKHSKDEIILAQGTRYNHIAKEIGYKKDLPSIGVEMSFPLKKKVTNITLSKQKPLAIYFIQLGFIAKLKSLNIIDLLRKKKMKVGHALTRDKITAQMIGAEKTKATHVFIMGQKEAMEGSIVIRNVETRSQSSILVSELPVKLKDLSA